MRTLGLLPLLLLAACGGTHVLRGGIEVPTATSQYTGPTDPGDPWERMNRGLLDIGMALDDSVFRPVAETYRWAVPEYGRARIRLFVRNLGEPLIFAHNILQLRPEASATTLSRFALNTTLGGLGFFDVATPRGLERQVGDMGLTFARYGIPEGPYLFIPLTGGSSLRDTLGDGADGFLNPLSLALDPFTSAYTLRLTTITRTAVGGIDLRAENLDTLDALRADSLDFYARLRSLTRQRRAADVALVRGGAAGGTEDLTVLDDPDAAPPAAPAAASGPARPAPARPAVPREWAGRALGAAALDAPPPPAEPPLAPARGDARWADGVLGEGRLAR